MSETDEYVARLTSAIQTSGLSPRVDHMVMLSEIYGVPLDLLIARKAV